MPRAQRRGVEGLVAVLGDEARVHCETPAPALEKSLVVPGAGHHVDVGQRAVPYHSVEHERALVHFDMEVAAVEGRHVFDALRGAETGRRQAAPPVDRLQERGQAFASATRHGK